MVEAWRSFSAAFQEFPFDIGVVYSGPQQLGPANLLWAKATGYHASMVGFPYDDLDSWRGPYPAQTFIEQFQKVSDGFMAGLQNLRHALLSISGKSSTEHHHAFELECTVAEACAIHFRSVANQARFVIARKTIAKMENPKEAAKEIESLRTILEDEMILAHRLFQLQTSDSRLGFEASNHYFYVPNDLMEKVLNCRYLLDTWLPAIEQG